jgi:hypothetical protein
MEEEEFPTVYLNRQVAKMCGCCLQSAQHYAQKSENGIHYVSEGRRKVYLWLEEDIEKFKNRPDLRRKQPQT